MIKKIPVKLLRILLPIFALSAFNTASFAESGTSKNIQIKAGKIHENCFKLKTSESIDYSFKASSNVAFNIHYHVGKKVKYPVKMDSVLQHTKTFKADFSQHYCLMWSNKGSETVTLEYSY